MHVHAYSEHTRIRSFTLTHQHTQTHTYTQTSLINPQITPPIITTLVLIRNYLKHFPIRVYVLCWAGFCLGNPTGLAAGRKKTVGSFANTTRVCACVRAHARGATRISGSGCGNQAVSVQTRGMRTGMGKKEREIKQQRRAPLVEPQYCRSLLLGLGTVIRRGHNETCRGTHAN